MSNTKMCNQKNCTTPADYRFTWPGSDEAGICKYHANKLRGTAAAMGMHIQIIPLSTNEAKEQ